MALIPRCFSESVADAGGGRSRSEDLRLLQTTRSCGNLSDSRDSLQPRAFKSPVPVPVPVRPGQARPEPEREPGGKWDALVLYAIRCAELEVEANVGQTMGLTTWLTKDVSWQGHVNADGSRGKRPINGHAGPFLCRVCHSQFVIFSLHSTSFLSASFYESRAPL